MVESSISKSINVSSRSTLCADISMTFVSIQPTFTKTVGCVEICGYCSFRLYSHRSSCLVKKALVELAEDDDHVSSS